MTTQDIEKKVSELVQAQQRPGYSFHKAVQDTERSIFKGRKDPRDISIPCAGLPSFNLRVSATARNRALRILDVLCRMAEFLPNVEVKWVPLPRRGHPHPEQRYFFLLGEHRFSLSIKETTTRNRKENARNSWPEYTFTPTGRLALEFSRPWLGTPFSWKDCRAHLVEDFLPEIAGAIPRMFESLELSRIEKEEEKKRWELQEEERLLQERKEACQQRNIKAALQAADDYECFQRLSRLTNHVREAADEEWLKFSRELMAKLDPLENGKKPWTTFQDPSEIS